MVSRDRGGGGAPPQKNKPPPTPTKHHPPATPLTREHPPLVGPVRLKELPQLGRLARQRPRHRRLAPASPSCCSWCGCVFLVCLFVCLFVCLCVVFRFIAACLIDRMTDSRTAIVVVVVREGVGFRCLRGRGRGRLRVLLFCCVFMHKLSTHTLF